MSKIKAAIEDNQMIAFEKDRIRELRENLGCSRTDLARLTELSRQSIVQWESGDCCPSVPALAQLCNKTDTEISYFFVQCLASEQNYGN